MTIGIGVLASSPGKKCDQIILLADTKGSFGDEFSMNRLHKTFRYPDVRLYATAAGKIDRAAELIALIHNQFLSENPTSYGNILLALNRSLYLYRHERFSIEIAPKIWAVKSDVERGTMPPEARAKIDEAWPAFRTGCDLIVGTFSSDGQAYLFTASDDSLENSSYPGFSAIGSGLGNAMFWLSYRNQHLGRNVRQSSYHAFEAKIMAESSPYVNEKLDMLIASYDTHHFESDFKPETADGVIVKINDLRSMWPTYGPQSTDEIK